MPAYHISEYAGASGYSMGSKEDNITNKNMLSQQAMTKSYIEIDGQWEETGVGITTWNNEWTYKFNNGSDEALPNNDSKIWRKHKSFIWDGETNDNGTYNGFDGDDDSFNWGVSNTIVETVQTNPEWKNVSTTTLYDHYSMPLEVRDINNNYASTKMGDDDTKIMHTSNSKYLESIYAGGEYDDEAQVSVHNLRTTDQAHTGTYGIKTYSSNYYFKAKYKNNEFRSGYYKLSVWVHKDTYQNLVIKFEGGTTVSSRQLNGEVKFAGDWVLMNDYQYLNEGYGDVDVCLLSNTGSPVIIDDIRIHPVSSSMTSYVYNEWDELEALLGANNLATKFKYDSQGRLMKTYQEVIDATGVTGGFKLIKENDYNYRLQQ
jgi:hypothetical protein